MRRTAFNLAIILLCLAGIAQAGGAGLRYRGRVLYRGTKTAVAGVLVELVGEQDDGRLTDEVLGTTRADADGRFEIVLAAPAEKGVGIMVSAVDNTADTGGDRREEGYDIKSHRIQLGFLAHPSTTKSNKILIERRRVTRGGG